MRRTADKLVLHKLDDGCVIHRVVRDIMASRERRHDEVRQAKTQLRGKTLFCRSVYGIRAGIDWREVAMNGCSSSGREAGIVLVRVHGDLRNVGDGS